MKNFLLIIPLIFSSYFGFSQSSPDAEYWITFEYTPKKGMVSKFEQAIAEKQNCITKLKKHLPIQLNSQVEQMLKMVDMNGLCQEDPSTGF